MKFYIAARFEEKEKVKEIYKILQEKGHQITVDWTLHLDLAPYEKNPERSEKYAIEDIHGVLEADVFVQLIPKEKGTGVFVELGAAIASYKLKGKPKIYLAGENKSRSIFYFSPGVILKQTVEEIIKDIFLTHS